MKKKFIILLGVWLLLSTLVVTVFVSGDRIGRAMIAMGWGVVIFWVLICGGLMYRFREPIRNTVRRIPLPWQIKFLLFVTALALLEEVVTTSMTNLAPLFGVGIGEAYITASTNFFDVVFFHSVINFMGPFVVWMFLLKRYDFSPFAAFFVWGITGVLAEVWLSGPEQFASFGFWIFVYGLMIYLPVFSLPPAEERGARPPKWYHYILLLFLPPLFSPLLGWIPLVLYPAHPQPTHFSPISAE